MKALNFNHSRLVLLGLMCIFVSACFSQSGYTPAPTSSQSIPEPESIPPGYVRSYVVFGKRYYVMANSVGFRENGLASWYGPNFDGRPTANGETFDMHQMTAAHKNLPLPTMVRVTNLENQRSIVVRVNDRGPFVGDRIIDLSYAAAVALDMVGPGTAPVEVVALNLTATPSEGPTSIIPETAVVYVQVGAFADAQNALNLVSALEQSGFSGVTTEEILLDERSLYRVKIGPVGENENRAELLDRLKIIGHPGARLVTH